MKEKYFLGIELPKKLGKSVDLLRREFYPYGLKNVPPHITVAGPFFFSSKEIFLSKKLEQIINSSKSFELEVDNFGTFQEDFAVFYLRVIANPLLIKLHLDVVGYLEQHNVYKYPAHRVYTPHITIANRLSDSELSYIKDRTHNIVMTERFSVEQLSLFRRVGGEPYEIVTRYSLDKYKDLRYHPEADLGNEWSPVKTSHP